MAFDTLQALREAEAAVLARIEGARHQAITGTRQAEEEAVALVAERRRRAQAEAEGRLERAKTQRQVFLEETQARALQEVEAMRSKIQHRVTQAAEMVVERIVGSSGNC